MSTAQDVLNVARRTIGNKESPAGSNRTPYGEWYGWNGVPWCAIWVSYCFYHAGMPLPPIQSKKGFAYCPYGVSYYRDRDRFNKTPEAGAIVFFDWRGDGIADHVGIVEKVEPGKVISIEGNTSYSDNSNGGQVMRRSRSLSRGILGFAHPDYDDKPATSDPNVRSWSGRHLMLTSPMQRGEDIREWQERMIELGYNLGRGGADGWFGEKSHAALLQFQKDKGLEVDGVIGPISWEATFK